MSWKVMNIYSTFLHWLFFCNCHKINNCKSFFTGHNFLMVNGRFTLLHVIFTLLSYVIVKELIAVFTINVTSRICQMFPDKLFVTGGSNFSLIIIISGMSLQGYFECSLKKSLITAHTFSMVIIL